jgi:immunodominant staphylococcal antigen A, putative
MKVTHIKTISCLMLSATMLSSQIVSAKEQVDFNLEKTHPIIKKHQELKKEHDVLEKEFKEYKKIVSKNSDAQKELDKELASKKSMEAELLDLQAKENKLTTEIQELKDKTLVKKTEKENAKKAQEEAKRKQDEEKKKQEEAKKKTSQASQNNSSTTSTASSQPVGSVRLANGNTAGEQGLYAAQKMSELTGVPASTWEHIIARESNGQVDAYNPSGASGLFQTMPGWGSTATVEDQIQAAYRAYSAQGLSAWGY